MRTALAGLVGLAVLLFGIVFSFSRGGYAAYASGILVFLFLPIRPRKRIALAVGALAAASLVFFAVPEYVRERAQSILTNVTGEQRGISLNLRLVMWRRAIADFVENPILGKGTWTSGLKDNFYFKILAEAGLLGLASFLGLLYVVLREEWRIIRQGIDDDLMRGLIMGLLPATVACLVVYNISGDFFGVHRFMGVVWIVLALALRYGSALERSGTRYGT
jgi:O-antigen ligase